MKPEKTRVFPEFAPETRFELPLAPFRAILPDEFERLKERLLEEKLFLARDATWHAPLRRAANDAAALAWSSVFPLLFFPVLFEEKVAELMLQSHRQKRIYAATAEPLIV